MRTSEQVNSLFSIICLFVIELFQKSRTDGTKVERVPLKKSGQRARS